MPQAHRQRGRPREAETDQRILSATLQLLAQVGYPRMSLDEVAQLAGVTKPTIYLRYPNKALLASAALAASRESAPAPQATGNLRADLSAQLRHFQAGVTHPYGMSMIGALLAEEHATPELLALYREQIVAPRRLMIRAVLAEAAQRGDLAADADIDLAVTQLIGSYYALYVAGDLITEDWAPRLVDQVLAGIAKA